ncbi:uncharacterized protein LOC128808897 isoform X3 [Vidua macroura]|uniref:uncharacterized protein LOC128808897 isoform X3 n=1 Tax=Vidua macroura TaxID=187451 RepID=UPI0023A82430|nr:uncharacterized protein LOC128808897 isoform X3 [Vidua macroura]
MWHLGTGVKGWVRFTALAPGTPRHRGGSSGAHPWGALPAPSLHLHFSLAARCDPCELILGRDTQLRRAGHFGGWPLCDKSIYRPLKEAKSSQDKLFGKQRASGCAWGSWSRIPAGWAMPQACPWSRSVWTMSPTTLELPLSPRGSRQWGWDGSRVPTEDLGTLGEPQKLQNLLQVEGAREKSPRAMFLAPGRTSRAAPIQVCQLVSWGRRQLPDSCSPNPWAGERIYPTASLA